jgi:hypothetical protein
MAGTSYTRQSSLTDGDTITASLFNDEYNQLVNAFAYAASGTTGHQHDGGAGEGGNIEIIGDADFKNKIVVDSTNNRWSVFVEVGGTAVEQVRIEDGVVYPVTDSDVDLGTDAARFKAAYIDSITATTSLTLGTSITVSSILDEDDMASNSATALATQQSIKAYVDSQVTAQDLDVTDGTTSISIDLDSEALSVLGGTGIDSTASGNGVTLAIDSTVATLTGSQTLTNKTLTSPDVNTPDIDGGTIDGTIIGGTTAAAGSFTTVGATGNITVGGTVDGRDVATDGTKLDGIEAGATADQTDAEIRAAVEAATDSNVFTDADHSKLNAIEASADVTDTANVTAAGALMDSELTNITAVKALNQGVATTDSPTFAGATLTTADINAGTIDGTVIGGSTAAAGTFTTGQFNTSLNVDGTVTADKLITDSNVDAASFTSASSTYVDINNGTVTGRLQTISSDFFIGTATVGTSLAFKSGNNVERLRISSGGDISFYEDTGTTAKLFWDASAESLGIGTSSPTSALDVTGTVTATSVNTGAGAAGRNAFSSGDIRVAAPNDTNISLMTVSNTLATIKTDYYGGGSLVPLVIQTGANNNQLYLDTGGNVGIGTSSPATTLDVAGTVTADGLDVEIADNLASPVSIQQGGNGYFKIVTTNGSESVQLGNSTTNPDILMGGGNVGIGTSSPSEELTIRASVPKIQIEDSDGTNQYGQFYHSAGSTTILARNNTSDGTIVFQKYDGTTTDETMRIDSSGNVGIGTSSPEATVHIQKASAGARGATLVIDNNAASTVGNESQITFLTDAGASVAGIANARIKVINTNAGSGAADLTFTTWSGSAEGERLRIDSSGNVGIGTSSPSQKLHVAGNIVLDAAGFVGFGGGTNYIEGSATNLLKFGTANVERMRIDASGNLLVGTTTALGSSGTTLSSDGYVYASNDNIALYLNRQGVDGAIAEFRKDGTTVGSIGTETSNSDLYIGNGDTAIMFHDGADAIFPHNASTNAGRDAAIDIGYSTYRFKDLYLSGGVYLGGTSAANHLDDYEEGSWTPTFIGETTNPTVSYNTQTATYIKIGGVVTCTMFIITNTSSGGSGHLSVSGLPFTVAVGQDYGAVVGFNFNWVSGENPHHAMAQSGTNKILLYKDATTNTISEPDDILASGNTYLRLTVTYFT